MKCYAPSSMPKKSCFCSSFSVFVFLDFSITWPRSPTKQKWKRKHYSWMTSKNFTLVDIWWFCLLSKSRKRLFSRLFSLTNMMSNGHPMQSRLRVSNRLFSFFNTTRSMFCWTWRFKILWRISTIIAICHDLTWWIRKSIWIDMTTILNY